MSVDLFCPGSLNSIHVSICFHMSLVPVFFEVVHHVYSKVISSKAVCLYAIGQTHRGSYWYFYVLLIFVVMLSNLLGWVQTFLNLVMSKNIFIFRAICTTGDVTFSNISHILTLNFQE